MKKNGKKSERLDLRCIQMGLYSNRRQAAAAIMAGEVTVAGETVYKPDRRVLPDALVKGGKVDPYPGFGGHKMAAALDHFGLDPAGLVCADIGASTGGFTSCLLQRNVSRVHCVDVGYGQLDYKLRTDPRVHNLERTNARNLEIGDLDETVDLVVMDVSFISIIKMFKTVKRILKPGGRFLSLVKPQFEAGRAQVGSGGIVRDASVIDEVRLRISHELEQNGFDITGWCDSPRKTQNGNLELFVLSIWKNQ